MKKSRVFLWLIVLAIGVTGVALHLIAPASEDDLPHPLNGLLRELHGIASFCAIFMVGYFFANHAQKKIAKRSTKFTQQVWDGYLHLVTWILLIVSGLLLYYPHEVGVKVAAVHWYLGVVLLVIFPAHYIRKNVKQKWLHHKLKRSYLPGEH